MQATISGRCCQTIASVISMVSWRAPAARATSAAWARSSAALRRIEPGGEGEHGSAFSRAMAASIAELSTPPERNIPYGTSLR